ncbi:MAG TPA: hypothetical protein VF008_17470 [Niastella sp.]
MEPTNVQILFFQHLKSSLPAHMSMVDNVADLLQISTDSAYRRIRGEKPISFDELKRLCTHYKVSLDQFVHIQTEAIIFNGRTANPCSFNFEQYLFSVLQNVEYMNSFPKKEMLYLNKDIPIFYHFNFPELAAFKSFFWMRSILNYPEFANKQFKVAEQMNDSVQKTGRKLAEAYSLLPSQEIWNIESINSTIRQIEYYKDTRVFTSRDDIVILYECLERTMDHIQRQAEAGCKFSPDGNRINRHVPYKMYVNEFILGDNTILALLGDSKVAYINHSVINFMLTKDPSFCEYTYQHFQNIIKKSTLISEVGEKERSRFFNIIKEKINARKNALL